MFMLVMAQKPYHYAMLRAQQVCGCVYSCPLLLYILLKFKET